jgi:hypothetical protein
MTPWIAVGVLGALANLFAFLAVRGRWGRMTLALGAASLAGMLAGSAIGDRVGLDLLRIGDVGLVAGSIGAQLAMLAALLLSTMGPQPAAADEG